MTATSALLAGRVAAERQMRDTVTIGSVTGQSTDSLGNVTSTTSAVYTGRAKIQTYEPYERNPEVGGATVTVQRYSVHVPVGAFVPAVGQVVTVTSSALDPNLAGRSFRVVALLHKTFATAYRLAVEETS